MTRIPVAKASEQMVIGLILKGNQAMTDIAFERLNTSHFFAEGHQDIFEVLDRMNAAGKAIDYGAVEDEITLRKQDHLLTWLLDAASRVENIYDTPIDHHITILTKTCQARQLLLACQETIAQFENNPPGDECLSSHSAKIAAIETETAQGTLLTARQVGEQLKRQIETSQVKSEGLIGMPTGFDKLNSLTGGFRPGELVIVAARPGVGKSVFGAQVLLASPYEPCALVTLEMSAVEILSRMVASQSGTSLGQIRDGSFESKYDSEKAFAAIEALQGSSILFEDCPHITITALRSKLRRLHQKNGIRIAIVDYLQLVSGVDSRNRVQELGQISRGLKSLAKELKIPIVALAQLNRSAAEDEPGLHHLRDSGEIEQDADIVILLHRPPASDDQKKTHTFPTLIKIAKQRNGPCVAFMSTLQGSASKFT